MQIPKLIEVKGNWLTGKVFVDGQPFPYPIRHLAFDMGPGEWPKLIVTIDAERLLLDQDMHETLPDTPDGAG